MHQVDKPTLAFAKEKYPDIVGWVPLLHADDGRPLFNTTQFARADGTYVSVFSVKPVYYEAIGGFWRPLSEITKHHGNRRIELNDSWRMATPRFIDWLSKRQSLLGGELLLPSYFGAITSQDIARPVINIGLTTTTVYPDPNPETTSVDGGVVYSMANPGVTWATIRDAASGTVATPSVANGLDTYIIHATATNQFRYLGRSFFLFDTSSINDSDTIDSGTLSIFHNNVAVDNSPAQTYSITSCSPASNTDITTADYDQFGTILMATEKAGSSVTRNAYNDFTLNSSGLSNISKTGVSKFAMMLKSDFDNTAPTWSSGVASGFYTIYADTTGTSSDPKLVVVHSVGTTRRIFLIS